MTQPLRLSLLLSVLVVLLSSACAMQQRGGGGSTGPALQTSTASLSYASKAPERLAALNTKVQEHEKELQANWKAFGEYPKSYNAKGEQWGSIAKVIRSADQAGRSQSYATAMRERNVIQRFADEHGGAMAWRVGGNVNAVLKKNACSYDAGGAVRFGLNDAFERQMTEHVQTSNEAYRTLESEGEKVGKANIKTLEDQIPTLSRTSYIVYIELEDIRNEMTRIVDEQGDIRDTLQAAQEDENARSADAKVPKGQRAAAKKRAEAYGEKIKALDKDTQAAKKWLQRMEEGLSELRSKHAKSVDSLVDTVESKG